MTNQSVFEYSGLFLQQGFVELRAGELSRLIIDACPWLDQDQEVGEEIGLELLNAELPVDVLAVVSAADVIDWHNTQVRNRGFQPSDLAYGEIRELLSRYGTVGSSDDADYFVLDDSFSTPDIVLGALRGVVAEELREALRAWLIGQARYARVTVGNQEGEELLRLSR